MNSVKYCMIHLPDIQVVDFCDWLSIQIMKHMQYENGFVLLFSGNNLERYAKEYLRQPNFNNDKNQSIQYSNRQHYTSANELASRTIDEISYYEFYHKALYNSLKRSSVIEFDFLKWYSENKKNLHKISLQSIPYEIFERIVSTYISERGMSADTKRKLLKIYKRTGWNRFINWTKKIITHKEDRDLDNTLRRYCTHSARFNCLILPLSDPESQKQFRTLIGDYWDNLNDLSGDILDIYYSESDLNKTGYIIAERLSSLPQKLKKEAPCLVLWDRSLSEAESVSTEGLSYKQVFFLIKSIVWIIHLTDIDDRCTNITLKEVINHASVVAEQKRKENLAGTYIVNNGEWHQEGDIVDGNIINRTT